MDSQKPSNTHQERPIREGLFKTGPDRLIGSRCSECGTIMFPSREFCPACDSDILPAKVALSPTGTIYSFTVVHQAPAGRKTPYALAYVDLENGGRVLAQIDADPSSLRIGMQVELSIRPVSISASQTLIGYVFVPTQFSKEAA